MQQLASEIAPQVKKKKKSQIDFNSDSSNGGGLLLSIWLGWIGGGDPSHPFNWPNQRWGHPPFQLPGLNQRRRTLPIRLGYPRSSEYKHLKARPKQRNLNKNPRIGSNKDNHWQNNATSKREKQEKSKLWCTKGTRILKTTSDNSLPLTFGWKGIHDNIINRHYVNATRDICLKNKIRKSSSHSKLHCCTTTKVSKLNY